MNHLDPPQFADLARAEQLLDALWRNVRLVSSIGLHTQGMTTEASEKMFREIAFSDVVSVKKTSTN
jgi:hypothetical protein